MKKIEIIILLLIVSVGLHSCWWKENDNHHSVIKFVNTDKNPIYINCGFEYPDTIVGIPSPTYEQYKVKQGETNTYAFLVYYDFWEDIINGKEIPSDTLMVFVFDANKLDSLYKESASVDVFSTMLKRYDLSLYDIQKMKWILYYPPTEAMQDIKMYPPYKE